MLLCFPNIIDQGKPGKYKEIYWTPLLYVLYDHLMTADEKHCGNYKQNLNVAEYQSTNATITMRRDICLTGTPSLKTPIHWATSSPPPDLEKTKLS